MTTVIDPSGAPTIVYNKSGTTILTMAGGQTNSPNSPNSPVGNDGVDIPRLSEITVLLAATVTDPVSGYDMVYRLPASADVGDVVEVYFVSGPKGPVIFPQIGEAILPRAVSTGTNNSAGFGAGGDLGWRYRKVASSTWVAIGTES